ncbi:MAG TPA: hypothetical protein VL117_08785, partial [Thermoleophilia bacterium]|nr:hypothetical protein [Thermoleophilia bacterium]
MTMYEAQQAQAKPTSNPKAGLAGFVCSVLGLSFPLVGTVGLILSIIGYRRAKRFGMASGLSIAGIVIGAVTTVLGIAVVVVIVILLAGGYVGAHPTVTVTTGSARYDRQVKQAIAVLRVDPNDASALTAAAEGYRKAANDVGGYWQRQHDLSLAAAYYWRLAALPDSRLAPDPSTVRVSALQYEAQLCTAMGDYALAAESYRRELKIEPHNYALYFRLASSDQRAGFSADAMAAFRRFLK